MFNLCLNSSDLTALVQSVTNWFNAQTALLANQLSRVEASRINLKHMLRPIGDRSSGPLSEEMKMDLPQDRIADLSIQPVDLEGDPAPVDGVPVWTVTPEGVVNLAVAADGMSAEMTAVPAATPGSTAQVKVDADARMGAEVKTITGLLDVVLLSGEAVSLNVNAVLRPVV